MLGADYDNEELTMCGLYYDSYAALLKKGMNNLTPSEEGLFKKVTKYLDRSQDEPSRHYWPPIVIIGGKSGNFTGYTSA